MSRKPFGAFSVGHSEKDAMTATLDLQLAIDAPPDKVFAAITDLHAGGRWLPGCTKLEVLTPGPHPEAPRVIELHCDGRKGYAGNVHYHFRYDIEPVGHGTILKMIGRIEPAGWFGKIMAPLMKFPFMEALRRDHAALKAHVEAEAAAA